MSTTLHCIVKRGAPPPVDLCAAALSSSDPPIAPDAKAEIARIRETRLASLGGPDSFEIERLFDGIAKLPPIEGPRYSRLLLLLADSSCDLGDLDLAFGELRRVSTGGHPFEKQDQNGIIEVEATATAPGTTPSEERLRIDAREASRNGIAAFAQVFARLMRIEDANLRADIIGDCRKILELRLHLDLTGAPS